MKPEPHTLIINRSESKCGNCGRPANPHETHHISVPSYQPSTSPGCGQRWVLARSDYIGYDKTFASIRPDLTWVSFDPAVGAWT